MEGYQSRSFDCEVGSHFHHGHVSGGPPIIPDGRISQVRFETLAFPPWAYPASERLKRWFAYTPPILVCPQARSTTCVGSMPALCPTTALPMEPPSVQSPFAQFQCDRYWGIVSRLLGEHYSSVFALTDSCANPLWLSPPSAISLVRGVCAGCYQPPLPAGSSRRYLCESFLECLVPYHGGSHGVRLPVSSSVSSAFPNRGVGRLTRFYPRTRFSAERIFEAADISLCSGLRVCSPPRSFLPLRILPQGS